MGLLLCFFLAGLPFLSAQESAPRIEETAGKNKGEKISRLMTEQDELQADVQDLVAEQTNKEVIKLLEECQGAMNEAIDGLEKQDTGGKTIAAQTDVIEKIFKAAEKKSESNGGSGIKGTLEMMRQMMNAEGDGENKEKDGKPGNKAGQGSDGTGDITSPPVKGASNDKKEPRRLPKLSGNAGIEYPREFSRAMDAYNKNLDSQQKSSTTTTTTTITTTTTSSPAPEPPAKKS